MELTPQERKLVQRCVDTHREPHAESMGCIWRIGSGVCIGYAFLVFGIGLYCFASGRPDDVSTAAFERSAWIAVWTLTILGFLWQAHELRLIIAKLAGGAKPSDGETAAGKEPEAHGEPEAAPQEEHDQEQSAPDEGEGDQEDSGAESEPQKDQEDVPEEQSADQEGPEEHATQEDSAEAGGTGEQTDAAPEEDTGDTEAEANSGEPKHQ